MRLVTVATHAEGYYDFLMSSCRRFNTPIDVLGFGEKWNGFPWRMNLVKKYLEEVDDDEVVCFIDAYDVIMLRPLDELEELFLLSGADIVVGHEKHISPLIHMLGVIIFGQCGGLSLNCGTYIGKKYNIMKMLDSCSTENDDQVLITDYSNANKGKVHVDTGGVFFLTISNPFGVFDTNGVLVEDGSVNYNGVRPFFAHGCGNTDMNGLVEKLGYTIRPSQKYKITAWNKESQRKKIMYYAGMYPHYVALAIIIVILIFYMILKRMRT